MPRRMVRRRTTRRRKFPRRAIARRRFARLRPSLITSGVHYFKRTVNNALENTTNLIVDGVFNKVQTSSLYHYNNANAAGNLLFGWLTLSFSLANLPNLSEFTSLFDSYQIRKVVVSIIPYQSEAQVSQEQLAAGAVNWGDFSPIVHYAIDHDQVPPVTSNESGVAVLQQYVSYKKRRLISPGGKGFRIVIKPRCATGVTNAAGTVVTGAETRRSQWLDLAQTGIPHYGLGMVFESISPSTTNFAVPFRMETTYYLKFKSPR